jgi:predicted transglutaminase-like protease
MKKTLLSFALLFVLMAVNAQYKISGKVIDFDTKKPVEGVSVYLSNTTKGTVTNNKGEFALLNIKGGKFDLVASNRGVFFIRYNRD